MLPPNAQTVLVGVLWLPVVIALGALYALVGNWLLMRWGRRTLIPTWATAALLCAKIMLIAMDPARTGWQVNSTPSEEFVVLAVIAGMLATALAPQMLVFHYFTVADDKRSLHLLGRGAALAGGTWILLIAIVVTIPAIAG